MKAAIKTKAGFSVSPRNIYKCASPYPQYLISIAYQWNHFNSLKLIMLTKRPFVYKKPKMCRLYKAVHCIHTWFLCHNTRIGTPD